MYSLTNLLPSLLWRHLWDFHHFSNCILTTQEGAWTILLNLPQRNEHIGNNIFSVKFLLYLTTTNKVCLLTKYTTTALMLFYVCCCFATSIYSVTHFDNLSIGLLITDISVTYQFDSPFHKTIDLFVWIIFSQSLTHVVGWRSVGGSSVRATGLVLPALTHLALTQSDLNE